MTETIGAVPDLPEIPSQTQADFLAMLQRILPSHYLVPLQEPGPGYEMLQAYAAIGARISQAVAHIANGSYIATAQAGSYSEGTVDFVRSEATWGAFTLLPGTVVGTVDGYTFTTLAPVTFGATEQGPKRVAVRATVRSWLYDQPGRVDLDDGEVLPGAIDRLIQPVLPNGGNFDPTIRVEQAAATVGGASPMLDGLGYDRGIIRAVGEADDSYRLRCALLPDTVTPNAISRTLDQILGPILTPLGLNWWVYEGWDLRVQTCWDAPVNETWTQAELHDVVPAYNANIFAYDYAPATTDAYQPGGWTNLILASEVYGAGILIGLPGDPSLFGLYASLAQNITQIKPAGVPVYYLTA